MNNYHDLDRVKMFIILNTKSCGSLPVASSYIIQQITGMTIDAGDKLISLVKQVGHIDSSSNVMIMDPVSSYWRTIILPSNSLHWQNKFELKPGCSLLANALH